MVAHKESFADRYMARNIGSAGSGPRAPHEFTYHANQAAESMRAGYRVRSAYPFSTPTEKLNTAQFRGTQGTLFPSWSRASPPSPTVRRRP